MCFRPRGLGFKQVVPNIRPGQVEFGTNVVKYMIPEKKLPPDLVVLAPDFSQYAQRATPASVMMAEVRQSRSRELHGCSAADGQNR